MAGTNSQRQPRFRPVKLRGGRVFVRSRLADGALFRLRYPAAIGNVTTRLLDFLRFRWRQMTHGLYAGRAVVLGVSFEWPVTVRRAD